jgi:hypothetical protein
MKTHPWIALILIAALLVPGWSAFGQQNDAAPNQLLRFLNLVPDTPDNRNLLSFGDVDAWYTAWNITPVDSADQLNALTADARARWMSILPGQTTPPGSFGLNYLLQGDQRPYYGFDFFQADRFISTMNPPDDFAVIEHHADASQIAADLLQHGYTETALDNGWTLYSTLDDYQTNLSGDVPRVGQLGQLNRIALNGSLMITARATADVENVVSAQKTLAADPYYAALAKALADPALGDVGQLVGVIMQSGLDYALDPVIMMLGPNATPDQVNQLRAQLGLNDPQRQLPIFLVAAFATYHNPTVGASFLVLAVPFAADVDAQNATNVIADRLKNYVSVRAQKPLSDYWTFEQATGLTVDGTPVALLTMRIDDPAPVSDSAPSARILTWMDLIAARDTGFLAYGGSGG